MGFGEAQGRFLICSEAKRIYVESVTNFQGVDLGRSSHSL
jgi:hypothetical protein